MRRSRRGDIRDRFYSRYVVDSESGCWLWMGNKHKDGYGVICGKIDGVRYVKAGVNMLAHRASWILHYGDIQDNGEYHGTVVMHKCDNPSCVNPEHLMLGSQKDNVHDAISKRRNIPIRATNIEKARIKKRTAKAKIDQTEIFKGENNANAKLTEDDVRKIKKLMADGIKRMHICSMFKITKSALYAIHSGRNWGWVN